MGIVIILGYTIAIICIAYIIWDFMKDPDNLVDKSMCPQLVILAGGIIILGTISIVL